MSGDDACPCFSLFLSRFNKITLENELSSVIKNHGENRNISIVNYRT